MYGNEGNSSSFIPITLKNSSAPAKFHGATTNILLVESGSHSVVPPWPLGPQNVGLFPQISPLPPHHQHTIAEWCKGGCPWALGLEVGPLCHMQSWLRGPLGSLPPYYARSGLTRPMSPSPLVCPSGGNSLMWNVHHWDTHVGCPTAYPPGYPHWRRSVHQW